MGLLSDRHGPGATRMPDSVWGERAVPVPIKVEWQCVVPDELSLKNPWPGCRHPGDLRTGLCARYLPHERST